MDQNKGSSDSQPPNADRLVADFIELTSATADEALFYLESHNFDFNAAAGTYFDSAAPSAAAAAPVPSARNPIPSPSESDRSASLSPPRSRSPSPIHASRSQYNPRSRGQQPGSGPVSTPGQRVGGIRTLSDLNRASGEGSGSDSDPPPEYYTGGQKSGMLVQDPRKLNDVDDIFNQARQFGVEEPADALQPSSSSSRFVGRGRLLSGEAAPTPQQPPPAPPAAITHIITFWRNGFTVDDGPLRMLDDPANASFLESITKSECPRELAPADRRTSVHVNLVRKIENFPEPERCRPSFRGTGRTLGSSSSSSSNPHPSSTVPAPAAASLTSAPTPSAGLVVDPNLPTTSIQLRLADGTRLVSRFNHHHTIRDISAFIDASRPNGNGPYKLQTMGFPPKQLMDLDQTIEQAGLANSVIIQKF